MRYTKKWFRTNPGGAFDLRDSAKNRIRRILEERLSGRLHQEWLQKDLGGTNQLEAGAKGSFDPRGEMAATPEVE